MSLTVGARFGAFEVTGRLGEGGMGEVYRARDTKLGRDVALKILPPAVAMEPDRIARFKREAQVLASLNRPTIAAIYGFEESHGIQALVLELVEGATLAERISRGPIPLADALPIARQIAEALEAAHDKGIVHRDLKPANVAVTPAGDVKVLDFGLAKALALEGASATSGDPSSSPTLTSPLTHAGIVILGTAAYMAPEQAAGRPVDRRADIWALGCVLFEMLTGRRPFDGQDITSVLARVIERDPDFTLLPADTPEPIRRLLRRTFEKNPARRLGSAHDAAIEIDDALAGAGTAAAASAPVAAVARSGARLPWSVAAVLALLLAFAPWLMRRRPAPAPSPMRYEATLPAEAALALLTRPPLAIAPDGSAIVFAATSRGSTRLYLRRREDGSTAPIPGTEDGSDPVFSPDGAALLFTAGLELKTVRFGSGPVTIAPIVDARGAAWLDDGSIVYTAEGTSGLMRLPPGGGKPVALTTVDVARGERTHRWPAPLPGSKAVLFIVGDAANPDDYNDATVEAVSIATGERRTVLKGAGFVRYLASGHLLLGRRGGVSRVPFDADRLTVTGGSAPFLEGIAGDATTGAMAFASANDGTVVYAADSSGLNGALRKFAWLDYKGAITPIDLPAGVYNDPRLALDGSRFAVIVGPSGSGDVWIYEIARRMFTRLTFERRSWTPSWAADGRTVYYASIMATGAQAETRFFKKPADGSRDAETIATIPQRGYIISLSRDGGSALICLTSGTRGLTDIASVSFDGTSRVAPIVASPADEFGAALSPDGAWFAFISTESGRPELYVRDRTEAGGRWQVSNGGAQEPRWSADGSHIFYRVDNHVMRVTIESRQPFRASAPEKLFDTFYKPSTLTETDISYDVDPRSDRLLMMIPADPAAAAPVTSLKVLLNARPGQ